MFVLNFVFLALLALLSLSAQAGFPRYVQGRWIITEENPHYEDTDEQLPTAEDAVWSNGPLDVPEVVTPQVRNIPTTPDSSGSKEQELDKVEESSVWKIVLIVGVLLVSLLGSVSMAYYYCVWRGGRIHYQAQKEVYS